VQRGCYCSGNQLGFSCCCLKHFSKKHQNTYAGTCFQRMMAHIFVCGAVLRWRPTVYWRKPQQTFSLTTGYFKIPQACVWGFPGVWLLIQEPAFFSGRGRACVAHHIQSSFRAHVSSYAICMKHSLAESNVTGKWSWPLSSAWCRHLNVEINGHSLQCNFLSQKR